MEKVVDKSFNNIIEKYLDVSNEKLDNIDEEIMNTETSSISTGLRRINYRFSRATTPKKYMEAFEMVSSLVSEFPLRGKLIWEAVASTYIKRFGNPSDGGGL